jgi:hypothetical protein
MEYREFTKEEEKWIRSLERVMKKAPNTLFMFCGGSYGSMYIMTKDENNQRYLAPGGAMDSKTTLTEISCGCEVDGGDW